MNPATPVNPSKKPWKSVIFSQHRQLGALGVSEAGCRLLGPGQGGINLAELNRSSLWAQGWEFSQRILLGSTVVGVVLALVSGWMAYRLFLRREARAVMSRGS